MFNDNQDNQAHTNTDIDQVAKDISTDHPAIGLGNNPTTFSPVLPTQATNSSAPPVMPDPIATPLPADEHPQIGPAFGSSSSSPAPSSPVPADLDDIKNQALEQLSPLVGKLEQSPEERFKTLMMMIQASDNHELVKEAYEAANKIEDEGVKAEALLAVVNEINYFTQQKQS